MVSVGFSKPFSLLFNSAFVENKRRAPPRVQKELTNRGIRRTTRTEQPHARRPRNPTASTNTNSVNSAQTSFNDEQNPTLVVNTALDQHMTAPVNAAQGARRPRIAVNDAQDALNAAPFNDAQEARIPRITVNAPLRAQNSHKLRISAHLHASQDWPIPFSHTHHFPFSHSTCSSSVSAFIPVGCLSLDSFTVHGLEVYNRCSTSSIGLGPL